MIPVIREQIARSRLHELGWTVEPHADGGVVGRSPDGRHELYRDNIERLAASAERIEARRKAA